MWVTWGNTSPVSRKRLNLSIRSVSLSVSNLHQVPSKKQHVRCIRSVVAFWSLKKENFRMPNAEVERQSIIDCSQKLDIEARWEIISPFNIYQERSNFYTLWYTSAMAPPCARQPAILPTLDALSATYIPVNLSCWKYWRFCFSELWEAIAQNSYPLQLGFCDIWVQLSKI